MGTGRRTGMSFALPVPGSLFVFGSRLELRCSRFVPVRANLEHDPCYFASCSSALSSVGSPAGALEPNSTSG